MESLRFVFGAQDPSTIMLKRPKLRIDAFMQADINEFND